MDQGYPGRTNGWRKRLDETYRVIVSMRESRSAYEICQSVLSYARRFGVTNLLAGSMPPLQASRREQQSHVLLSAWPEEWSRRYFANGYLYRDPAISLVRRGKASFRWSEMSDYLQIDTVGRRVLAEAEDFQLREGLTISFETVEGRRVGFSLAGDRLELDDGHRNVLHLVSACALGQAVSLCDGPQKLHSSPSLSTRQRDVLSWAAEGCSVEDIAERLCISRNTADTHLRIARLRLGVRTTIQAVAEGLRRGLIS